MPGILARNGSDPTFFQTVKQRDEKNKQKGTMSIMNKRKVCSVITAAAMAASIAAVPLYALDTDTEENTAICYEAGTSDDLPDSAELEEAYINKLFYGGGIALFRDYGASSLSGASLELYELLRTEIEKIAAGTRTSTDIRINMTQNFSGSCNMKEEVEKVINILMADLPSEFYWYDKTVGFARYGTSDMRRISRVIFGVSTDYWDGKTILYGSTNYRTGVDTSKINSAKAAAANAQEIAARYADTDDYHKILGFRNEICSLVSYDNYAASSQPSEVGIDPWQMVYVFDGNPNTNVVCEGYAKAFQYLCDLSGIECYTVTGTMNTYGHMWNIVTLEGENYLVDITNCDTGGIGYPDKLLLAGSADSTAAGLSVNIGGNTVSYSYKPDTVSIYPADIRTMSETNYTALFASPETLTVEEEGSADITLTVVGTEADGIVYTADTEGRIEISPKSNGVFTITGKNAGVSTVTFSVTNGKKTAAANCAVTVTCKHEYQYESDANSHWQVCAKCGETVGSSTHNEVNEVTKAPTSTEDGIRTYSCCVCGRELRTEPVPALGESHTHEYTITNSDGINHWNECVCGEKDTLSVTPHTPVNVEEIAAEPTCSTDGLKYVITKCSVCGREISRVSQTMPMTGTHTASAEYVSDPTGHWKTCTSCGTVMGKEAHTPGSAATENVPQTCTVCGYVIAPALTHDHTFSTEWSGDGTYHWHNATCGHIGEVSEKAVHTWDSGIVTKEPTETEKGIKIYACTVCGRTKTEEISVLAHTHNTAADWSFDSAGHWHSCSGCDEKIDFNSHASASEITKSPTATETGTRRYFCTVCGCEIRTETIPATGYTPSRPSTPATPSNPSSPSFNENVTSSSGTNQGSTAPREPSLSNGSGKTGWDSVVSDIEAAPAGRSITVNMNGTVQLPADVINSIAVKDVDLVLKMNNKITWKIKGSSTYAKNVTTNVNMRATLNAGKIPAREIKKVSRGNKVVRLSLAHKGNFGFDAEMTVTLGKKYSGKYANLMYYDPADKSFELVDTSLIKNGKTNLEFSHGADYVIVISKTPFEADEDTSD